MADTDEDEFLNEIDDEQAAHPLVKRLRERGDRNEKKATAAEERALKAERRLALLEAGIDPNAKDLTPEQKSLRTLFAENYRGEASAEKVREAAAAHPGLLPPDPVDENAAAAERIAEATRGNDGTDPTGQLSRESLKSMTPEQIVQAKEDGRLNKVLGIAP